MKKRIGWMAWFVVACGGLGIMTGCLPTRYVTPGGPARFSDLGLSPQAGPLTAVEREQLTDSEIRRRLALKPLASFPAALAWAQVQESGYSAYGRQGYGRGRASVVMTQDEPAAEAIGSLGDLPGVTRLSPLNRMILPEEIRREQDLRGAAAALHADILLLYTFDTRITTKENIPYAGLVTLGLFPDRSALATVTASAVLVDVRTGYVYGATSASSDRTQLASAWTRRSAMDDALRTAERGALVDLVENVKDLWGRVLKDHAPMLAVR
jgi:hypothetical protein